MKIKRSFVTNSSSCSYLTYIPKGSINVELLWIEEVLSKKSKNMLLYVEDGNNLYSESYEDESTDSDDMQNFGREDFQEVLNFIKEFKFPLYFDDNGSDGVMYLENIADTKFGKEIRKLIEKELEKKNGTTT